MSNRTLKFYLCNTYKIQGHFISINLVLALVWLVFFSCQENKVAEISYYNVDSLLREQVKLLKASNVVLTKQVLLNGKRDSVTLAVNDTALWATELEAFNTLKSINKITAVPSYKIDNTSDTRSNLTVRTFSTSLALPVEYVKLYFYNSPANLRKIEAVYSDGNYMFSSSRQLSMEFENIYDKITLTHYTIDGVQKIIMGDSVHFYIKGNLKIN